MPDIIRRDPFGLNGSLRQAMDRFFDDPFFRHPMGYLSEEGTLALDISETEQDGQKAIVVRADLPGFSKDEVDVQVHEGVLSINARHSEEHEEQHDRWYRRERSWGSLNRRVALPGIVMKDAPVEATLKDGVLTLHIALPNATGPKQIEIKSE